MNILDPIFLSHVVLRFFANDLPEIALQYFPRTGAGWRTKTYKNQKGEKIYEKIK
jgi:hypothetical protein